MKGIGITINNDFELPVLPKRNNEGKIISGLELGKTIKQNTAVILICTPGEFKEQPTQGVGIENILLDEDYLAWRRKIRLALELDGQHVTSVNFKGENLEVDASYY